MGSILELVNRVAAEFPDKTISTLAYQYSRPAPAHLKPADNVNIVLCTIELNRSRPIATDAGAASFRKDMEDWARITDNILIWDYVIQFSNLVSPFPNLRVLQPNLRYFVDNHAVAMFQQGNREVGGEFSELRAYVIAKLLWNPDADAEALVDDFISEFATGRKREILKILVELLAAIPSVVWGFIGLTIMNPLIIEVFNVPVGLTILNAGVILGLMAAPIMTTIAEDALKAVPDGYREAAEAMGATRWQVIRRVVLPSAKNGLVAAILLGVGRDFGETMAVLMASGHAINLPTSPFDSVRALTATIASELGETARGSEHYKALFTLGILLFLVTFTINLLADVLVRGRKGKKA